MKKIDMHVHTAYSEDGESEVRDIVRRAKEIGLHGIAITDHNSIEAWEEALRYGKEYGIIIVRGEEVSSRDGHILAYGIHERIEKGKSAEETVKEIREQGGVAVAAHPYRISNGLGDVVRKVDFDAIEALNSRSPRFINRKAERLAKEMKKPMTGGSDAHRVEEIGSTYTIFIGEVHGEKDVIHAIREGKVRPGGREHGYGRLLGYGLKKMAAWIKRKGKKI